MNIAEIKAWRQDTIAEAEAKFRLANSLTAIEKRHRDIIVELNDQPLEVIKRFYLAYAMSAYGMVINLLQAPDSDTCKPTEERPFMGKISHARAIDTDEIGNFRASCITTSGLHVDASATSLGLVFLYPPRSAVNSSDRERTEEILPKNSMGSIKDEAKGFVSDFEEIHNRRETVAEVCRQAGVKLEEVPTIGEAIAISTPKHD